MALLRESQAREYMSVAEDETRRAFHQIDKGDRAVKYLEDQNELYHNPEPGYGRLLPRIATVRLRKYGQAPALLLKDLKANACNDAIHEVAFNILVANLLAEPVSLANGSYKLAKECHDSGLLEYCTGVLEVPSPSSASPGSPPTSPGSPPASPVVPRTLAPRARPGKQAPVMVPSPSPSPPPPSLHIGGVPNPFLLAATFSLITAIVHRHSPPPPTFPSLAVLTSLDAYLTSPLSLANPTLTIAALRTLTTLLDQNPVMRNTAARTNLPQTLLRTCNAWDSDWRVQHSAVAALEFLLLRCAATKAQVQAPLSIIPTLVTFLTKHSSDKSYENREVNAKCARAGLQLCKAIFAQDDDGLIKKFTKDDLPAKVAGMQSSKPAAAVAAAAAAAAPEPDPPPAARREYATLTSLFVEAGGVKAMNKAAYVRERG